MHCVYILHSKKLNRFYIGSTSDFDLRLEFHLKAESRKFTYNAHDWELFLKIDCQTKTQALAIEKHIKAMKSKIYIQNLIKHSEIIQTLLLKYLDC
jgi:putative endonuclease